MAKKNHKLKKDSYSKSRGGNSSFLDIFCSNCQTHLLLYQKDGLGGLFRLYLDRIIEPDVLSSLNGQHVGKSSLPNLSCGTCKSIIAVPMVYRLENRLAFRLIRGKFNKKKSDGAYPPDN